MLVHVQKGKTSMYARVVSTPVEPGNMDETIQIFQNFLVPVAKQQRGFKGILLLTERSTPKIMVISVWETEDDMKASEASDHYREQIVARFSHLFNSFPSIEIYEVSARE
jgi:heme-degrading monooxygenase HmoA